MSFSSPDLPPPQEPAPPPEKSDAEVQSEALARRKRLRASLGSASTVLTGGQGAAGSALASKQLLGS